MWKVLLSADHQRGRSRCVYACVSPVFTAMLRCCARSWWLQVIVLKQWDSDGWLHGGHERWLKKLWLSVTKQLLSISILHGKTPWGSFLGFPGSRTSPSLWCQVQELTSHCTQPSRIHRAPKMERIVYPARPKPFRSSEPTFGSVSSWFPDENWIECTWMYTWMYNVHECTWIIMNVLYRSV